MSPIGRQELQHVWALRGWPEHLEKEPVPAGALSEFYQNVTCPTCSVESFKTGEVRGAGSLAPVNSMKVLGKISRDFSTR